MTKKEIIKKLIEIVEDDGLGIAVFMEKIEQLAQEAKKISK